MHSFYNFDFAIRQPLKNITRLILKANDKQVENSLWDLYLVAYQNMTEETFVTFKEFASYRKQNVEVKTEEDILDDVKEILSMKVGE